MLHERTAAHGNGLFVKPPKEAFSCRLEEPRSCPAGASGPKGRKGAATRFELARSCAATRPFKVGARRQTRTPAFVVARQRSLLLGSRVEHVERVDFFGGVVARSAKPASPHLPMEALSLLERIEGGYRAVLLTVV